MDSHLNLCLSLGPVWCEWPPSTIARALLDEVSRGRVNPWAHPVILRSRDEVLLLLRVEHIGGLGEGRLLLLGQVLLLLLL